MIKVGSAVSLGFNGGLLGRVERVDGVRAFVRFDNFNYASWYFLEQLALYDPPYLCDPADAVYYEAITG